MGGKGCSKGPCQDWRAFTAEYAPRTVQLLPVSLNDEPQCFLRSEGEFVNNGGAQRIPQYLPPSSVSRSRHASSGLENAFSISTCNRQ
jgi:hypothetical protein